MSHKNNKRLEALEFKFHRFNKSMSLTIKEDGESYEDAEVRATRENPNSLGHLVIVFVEPNPENF